MEPFFFGTEERRLFGAYHPAESSPRGVGVLVCPPLLAEYMRVNSAMRQLADRLAQSSYDALRFDYTGTGDSFGAFETCDAETWIGDIERAARELGNIAGNERFVGVGVRMGATLLCAAARRIPSLSKLVLWDPVSDVCRYFATLERTQTDLIAAHFDIDVATAQTARDEFIGFRVDPECRRSLERLTTQPIESVMPNRLTVEVVTTRGCADNRERVAAMVPRGAVVNFHEADIDCHWNTHKERVIHAPDVVSQIVGLL